MTSISKQLDTNIYDSKLPPKVSTTKKTIKNCKNIQKTKDPKCNDQEGCERTVGKGCLNK